MSERWDEHFRPIEGEADSDYWQRQIDWTNNEAAKIDIWLAGARAGLAVHGCRPVSEIPPRSRWQQFIYRLKQIITYPDSLR